MQIIFALFGKLARFYLGSWREFTPPRAVAKRPLNTPYLNCAQKATLLWFSLVCFADAGQFRRGIIDFVAENLFTAGDVT